MGFFHWYGFGMVPGLNLCIYFSQKCARDFGIQQVKRNTNNHLSTSLTQLFWQMIFFEGFGPRWIIKSLTYIIEICIYDNSSVHSNLLLIHIITYTAKNPEKEVCPFLENEDFFLRMSIFFSKRRIIRRFEKKNAHFEKRVLIFEKRTDFFPTIFPSVVVWY